MHKIIVSSGFSYMYLLHFKSCIFNLEGLKTRMPPTIFANISYK